MGKTLACVFLAAAIPFVVIRGSVSEKQEVDVIVKTVEELVKKWDGGELSEELFRQMAYGMVKSGLERYPESVELWNTSDYLAFIRSVPERQALLDSVKGFYKDLWERNPDSPVYAYKYARFLRDPQKEAEIAEKIIEKNPDFYWGYYLAGASLENQQKYPAAIEAYEKAVELDSSDVAMSGLASCYFETGQYEKAYAAALAAYHKYPDSRSLYGQAQKAAEALEDNNLILGLNQVALNAAVEANKRLLSELITESATLFDAFTVAGQADSARFYRELGFNVAHTLGNKMEQRYILSLASFEARRGETDSAIDLVELLVNKGFTDYITLKASDELKPLDGQPRYDSLLASMVESRMKDRLGKPAPDFTLVSLERDSVTLSSLRGKPVMLDFWGLGCGPCREATPYIKAFYEKYKGEIQVLSVEVWESNPAEIKNYILEEGVTYEVLIGSMELAKTYEISGVPTFVFIDAKGDMAFRRTGFAPEIAGEWEMFLEALTEDERR